MKRFGFPLERVRKWRQDQAELEEMRLRQLYAELRTAEAAAVLDVIGDGDCLLVGDLNAVNPSDSIGIPRRAEMSVTDFDRRLSLVSRLPRKRFTSEKPVP